MSEHTPCCLCSAHQKPRRGCNICDSYFSELEKVAIKLNNWSVSYGNVSPYTPPELLTVHLIGTRESDGKIIRTSPLQGLEGGEFIKTKSGSLYELGTVDTQYEAMFPNARERFFGNFK